MAPRKMRLRRIKPKVRRQESWRYVRVKESWRRPRGKTSRVRLRRRGWPAMPMVGYRRPKTYRGLHPSGYRERLIHNVKELEGLNPEVYAVRIGHRVGGRKRAEIIDQAQRLGFKILNVGGAPAPIQEQPTETEPEQTQRQETEGVDGGELGGAEADQK